MSLSHQKSGSPPSNYLDGSKSLSRFTIAIHRPPPIRLFAQKNRNLFRCGNLFYIGLFTHFSVLSSNVRMFYFYTFNKNLYSITTLDLSRKPILIQRAKKGFHGNRDIGISWDRVGTRDQQHLTTSVSLFNQNFYVRFLLALRCYRVISQDTEDKVF